MKNDFLQRSLIMTVLLASLFFLGSLFFDFRKGIAFFVGALWGVVSLYFLKHLLQSLVYHQRAKSLFLVTIKWPLLYVLGYWLLRTTFFSTLYLLLGSSMIFGVLLIQGIFEGGWSRR